MAAETHSGLRSSLCGSYLLYLFERDEAIPLIGAG